ncbi:hypothetical protein OHA72_33105 [Dactylosporangium sp. NBC_01737]|uniref:hypothetical protein n=1 Tax=Dactylosporangium sp. NBC_01737 TaxID=2975959 RepID=UPI002E13FD3C|nr:hypothetical protein OHA72_33105 [Dactylosporangium sp. NBC_01737]
MSHQQLFEAVLADEPPARDTLDGLVRRSRRRIRYRRLAGTGVALVATGVVAALALPPAPPTMTGAPPSTAASSPSRARPLLLGRAPTEAPGAVVPRLRDATTAAVTRVAPATVQLLPTGDMEMVPGYTDDNPHPQSTLTSVNVKGTVTVGGVTGKLVVTIKRRAIDTGCAAAFPPDVAPSVLRLECAANPDVGQPYTSQTVRDEQPGMIRHIASQDRQDGTTVEVSVSNEPALTGEPPLTGEQLVQIAGDPRLTLYP